jgi:hypothetical protein
MFVRPRSMPFEGGRIALQKNIRLGWKKFPILCKVPTKISMIFFSGDLATGKAGRRPPSKSSRF